jgi:hypothetical protein
MHTSMNRTLAKAYTCKVSARFALAIKTHTMLLLYTPNAFPKQPPPIKLAHSFECSNNLHADKCRQTDRNKKYMRTYIHAKEL